MLERLKLPEEDELEQKPQVTPIGISPTPPQITTGGVPQITQPAVGTPERPATMDDLRAWQATQPAGGTPPVEPSRPAVVPIAGASPRMAEFQKKLNEAVIRVEHAGGISYMAAHEKQRLLKLEYPEEAKQLDALHRSNVQKQIPYDINEQGQMIDRTTGKVITSQESGQLYMKGMADETQPFANLPEGLSDDAQVQGIASSERDIIGSMDAMLQNSPVIAYNYANEFLKYVDQIESKIMTMYGEQMAGIDPGTQAVLAEMRRQGEGERVKIMNWLNSRGILRSGTMVEEQNRWYQNQLNTEERFLAQKLTEAQDKMMTATMQFAQIRLQGLQWGEEMGFKERALTSEEQRFYAGLGSQEKMFYTGLESEERRFYEGLSSEERRFYAGLDVEKGKLALEERAFSSEVERWEVSRQDALSQWESDFKFKVDLSEEDKRRFEIDTGFKYDVLKVESDRFEKSFGLELDKFSTAQYQWAKEFNLDTQKYYEMTRQFDIVEANKEKWTMAEYTQRVYEFEKTFGLDYYKTQETLKLQARSMNLDEAKHRESIRQFNTSMASATSTGVAGQTGDANVRMMAFLKEVDRKHSISPSEPTAIEYLTNPANAKDLANLGVNLDLVLQTYLQEQKAGLGGRVITSIPTTIKTVTQNQGVSGMISQGGVWKPSITTPFQSVGMGGSTVKGKTDWLFQSTISQALKKPGIKTGIYSPPPVIKPKGGW